MLTDNAIQLQAVLYICNIILHNMSQNCIVCVREELFFVKMLSQNIFNKQKNPISFKNIVFLDQLCPNLGVFEGPLNDLRWT